MRKGKLIESKTIYLVDNKLNAYALLNTTYIRSTYRSISFSTVMQRNIWLAQHYQEKK